MEENPDGMGNSMPEDEFNDLLDLLLEKEPMVQHLDQSKEFMENKINKMETDITKAIKNEWETTEQTMQLNQHKRNRNIVKEIITTCNTFRSEIKEEFNNLRGEEEET